MSTPTLTSFTPKDIKWQNEFMSFFYALPTNKKHEILLSGSFGSAKSIVAAHIGVRHVLENKGAVLLLARRALPDLKDTIFLTVKQHIANDLVEGVDYWVNESRAQIKFKNGSMIISRSWADKNYLKLRSLNISAAIVEELTENTGDDKNAYLELSARVGRLSGIKQSFIICCTNPADPQHWAYDYFIEPSGPNRYVFYSVTSDNPYLPDWYVDDIKSKYNEKELRRYLYGQWVELSSEKIYHAYDRTRNYIEAPYEVKKNLPIRLSYDFNIGLGKPLSVCFSQYDEQKDTWHFYDEVVVEGQRTEQSLLEAESRGLITRNNFYIIHGDAAGKHRDTRSNNSDYDIIKNFFVMRGIAHELRVTKANPSIRDRHNIVNGYFLNAKQQIRAYVYKKCFTLDKGLRLTKLKKGASYIEEEIYEQHITTAIGYGMMYEHMMKERKLHGGGGMI